ncbi:MAG: DUF1223 domain-containing protein [Candidatus Obscuribacterales bacterium]|nr:DUF1223 domain-containing protein [Candidatus Obscuribacterales bacterium]
MAPQISHVVTALFFAGVILPGLANEQLEGKVKQPVLVELFTSEGCSSCPPADRLAIHLQDASKAGHEVIILSEHVDYWNHLGWQDKYSSHQFTDRQQDYAKVLAQNSVYTPEAVVDGVYGMVGSDRNALQEAVEKCFFSAKASVTLTAEQIDNDPLKRKVSISSTSPVTLAGKQAQIYVVVTEDNLKSQIKSGENGGAVLEHTGVVRYLKKLSPVVAFDPQKGLRYTAEIPLNPQWKKQDLRVVGFLQDPITKRIWGASQIKIE